MKLIFYITTKMIKAIKEERYYDISGQQVLTPTAAYASIAAGSLDDVVKIHLI